jgi:hypothetical protein
LCPLCKQTMETVCHLFVECRTRCVFGVTFGLRWASPTFNQPIGRVTQSSIGGASWQAGPWKTAKPLPPSLLVTWEILNEWNAWVFRNNHARPLVLLDKIENKSRKALGRNNAKRVRLCISCLLLTIFLSGGDWEAVALVHADKINK